MGVLGIGTAPAPALYMYSVGSDALGLGREEWRPEGPVGFSSSGGYPRALRSAVVKNFFMSSARVEGDTPLMDVPLMMVTLSVFGCENMYCGAFAPPSSTRSVASGCRELTATNPEAGEWGRERPLAIGLGLVFVLITSPPAASRQEGLPEP